MDLLQHYYPESRFGGFTDLDGTIRFYTRISSLVDASSVVLDVGCGRGAFDDDPVRIRRELRSFKGRCAKVVGIDVDLAGGENSHIDEFRRIEGARWPLDDASVDVAFADYVLEHVPEPDAFFGEARRVLRPGGVMGIRTPNAWSYVAVASRVIPNRHHVSVLGAVQPQRKEEDVFPTLYRCNTRRRLRRALESHGFDAVVLGAEAEPSYLGFSRLAYGLGVLHQRWAPGLFKINLLAFGRRLP